MGPARPAIDHELAGGRQVNSEDGSLVLNAGDDDVAVMVLDHGLHDAQSQSRATPTRSPLGREKGIEHSILDVRGDPYTGICDVDSGDIRRAR